MKPQHINKLLPNRKFLKRNSTSLLFLSIFGFSSFLTILCVFWLSLSNSQTISICSKFPLLSSCVSTYDFAPFYCLSFEAYKAFHSHYYYYSENMVPITTYFFLLVSSFFYVVWDARIVLEEYAAQRDRLGFRQSSSGFGAYAMSHLDVPIIMWIKVASYVILSLYCYYCYRCYYPI